MEPLTLAYFLIGLGVVLMLAELFIPTGGICLVLAGAAVIAGVAMTFSHGETSTGIITLVGVFVAFPLIGFFAFRYWPSSLGAKSPDRLPDAALRGGGVRRPADRLRHRGYDGGRGPVGPLYRCPLQPGGGPADRPA